MPRTVRAILSDLDDTLFDHHRATRTALSQTLGEDPAFSGWTLDELDRRHREILEVMHLQVLAGRMSVNDARVERFRQLLHAAAADVTIERAVEIARAYRKTYETAWHPVSGALALLTRFKASGLPVIVVTNNSVTEQQQKLALLGLAALVDDLVTSEEIGSSKPAPEIFHAALRRASVSAADAVMLGDAWATDVEGARAAGVRAVWLNRFGAASPDPAVSELTTLEPVAAAFEVITGHSTQ